MFTSDKQTSAILDIETLDLKPTSIITSIAIIAFDRKDFTVVDHLDLKPDFFSQLSAGRTYSPETIQFHRREGTLPEITNSNQSDCQQVIADLNAFIRENKPRHIWIQGPDFDRPIIEDFCLSHSRPLPWHFTKSRDARTTYDLAFPGVKHPKRPHKALEDCQATLSDLVKALSKLNALESI